MTPEYFWFLCDHQKEWAEIANKNKAIAKQEKAQKMKMYRQKALDNDIKNKEQYKE